MNKIVVFQVFTDDGHGIERGREFPATEFQQAVKYAHDYYLEEHPVSIEIHRVVFFGSGFELGKLIRATQITEGEIVLIKTAHMDGYLPEEQHEVYGRPLKWIRLFPDADADEAEASEQENSAELDWDKAIARLDKYTGEYNKLIGQPGVEIGFALRQCIKLRWRFNAGERSQELFDAMMAV